MKSTTVILSLLAAAVIAQPHKNGHQHRHINKHEARDAAVKWVTEWAFETEVVAVTETIWVSEGFVPPTTSTTTTTTASRSRSNVPAQFFQPATKAKSPSPSPSPTTTLVVVAPPPPAPTSVTPLPAPVAKAPEPKAPEVKAPEPPKSTYVAPPPPPPAPTTVPVVKLEPVFTPPPPPPQTSKPSPPVSQAPTSGGSSGGECSKGSPCEGDITHYDANAGLGACGWLSDGENENVIALPHGLMGTQSNGNPYCGRNVKVVMNGKTISAKIVDKCMGCVGHSIDLSNHAFKELEDMGVGRTQASWYFSD